MVKGVLVLKDGSIYAGEGFGAEAVAVGELVFSTAMTGYQEALTDPSYAGQILMPTYPLIGNYGVNDEDGESKKIWAQGFVVRERCEGFEHAKARESIDEFLKRFGVPGISGLDTRAIVRKIRSEGVMPACIAAYEREIDFNELLAKARALDYSSIDFVREVSEKGAKVYGGGEDEIGGAGKGREGRAWSGKKVVLIDCGAKRNIVRELNARGVQVVSVNCETSADEIRKHEPDGLVISNGPGDPALLGYVAGTVKQLIGKMPIFGICLGIQVLAHAVGGKTYKLKFGHRGANHPVKDLASGRVRITTQNHGFAVDAKSLPKDYVVTQVNGNDGTVEGMRHESLPVFAVQYHPEAHPGPRDSEYLFDEFVKMMK
ncbi:MAG: glutamine-hydrolyzing carbamoyl-phosphate synthase small subunit [Candidatus Burarchaeum sp.]|nr:glutamine-hydrolyzing carbamoyl-phosphate synthase small subunit [Candidatus Burarchaeum sp.]MDO8339778.1 glutamine-hydrolyzing carbamoyl-phosphate synthase small subunit [Candidatus Burarchaeum sp.]